MTSSLFASQEQVHLSQCFQFDFRISNYIMHIFFFALSLHFFVVVMCGYVFVFKVVAICVCNNMFESCLYMYI